MTTANLPDVTAKIYQLLEPLDPDDRRKVVSAAFTLFGEQTPQKANSTSLHRDEVRLPVGNNAKRWMQQNQIDETTLQDIFHVEPGNVEIIASDVPGSSKRAQTKNCYLLAGLRSLLANDQPGFQETDAVDLCKHLACFDSPNHANTRRELGNQVRGNKDSGFSLSAPGLRAAGELVKAMTTNAT